MPPRPPLTHFLSLPLVNETSRSQLTTSLQRLTADLVGTGFLGDAVAPEMAIRPLRSLHLTLGVMSLTTSDKLAGSLRLLEDVDLQPLLQGAESTNPTSDLAPPAPGSLGAHPLTISLKSLASMGRSSTAASVIYTIPVDRTGRLEPFCNGLRDIFERAGFIVEEDRPLLLHTTLVNTAYLQRSSGYQSSGQTRSRGNYAGHGRKRRSIYFDARDFIDSYSDFEFAKDVTLDKISICKMGTKRFLDADGNFIGEGYEVVAERAL